MKQLIVASLALALLAGLAPAQEEAKLSADAKTAVEGNTAFAGDLYAQLSKEPGNLFFSPYSISTALGMTYAGAGGNTAAQMQKTLHFGLPQRQLHPAFKEVIREVNGEGRKRAYQLVTVNRLWGQKDYGFLPNFIKGAEAHYGAGLKEVDFIGATEQARETINGWVEEQTNKKIKELLKPGILTEDTRIVLTNAIYFKAAWEREFDPKKTTPGEFAVTAGKKVKVPMMHGSIRTNFHDAGDFKMLNLRYENGDLSMILLLPKEVDGLAAVEKKLEGRNLTDLIRKARTGDYLVDTKLPKFKVTAEFHLNKVLAAMGMPDAFNPRKADFSFMTSREKLYISHVVHKAFVDVHEKGTEAAAATAVVGERLSLPRQATFHADRPFAFVIHDNRTGSVLFMGRVADPS